MLGRAFLGHLLLLPLLSGLVSAQSPATQPAAEAPADVEAQRIVLPIEIPQGYRFDRIETAYRFIPAGSLGDLAVAYDLSTNSDPAFNGQLRTYFIHPDKAAFFMTSSAAGVGVAFDGQYAWSMGRNWIVNELEAYDPALPQSATAGAPEGLPTGFVQRAQITPWKKGVIIIAAYTEKPQRWTWIAKANYRPGAAPKVRVILSCKNTDPATPASMPINHIFTPSFAVTSLGPPGSGDKATPCVYVGRAGSDQMIMIDPDTLDTQLCKLNTSAIPSTAENLRPSEHISADAGTFSLDGVPAWDVVHDKSIPPADSNPYAFDGKTLTIKKTGQTLAVAMPAGAAPAGHVFRLQTSSVFGLIADDQWQLVPFTGAALDALPPASSTATWLQQQAEANPIRASFEALAYYYHAQGDTDDSARGLADAFKNVNPKDLNDYMELDRVADELMRWGDYKLAQSVADAAARCGARWAIALAGNAAEGLGQWDRAEKLARSAGESYNDYTEWYNFCVRTNHGDKSAAKASCAAHIDPNSDDPDTLFNTGAYDLYSCKTADAEAIYNKIASLPKPTTWSILESALLAQDRGDTKSRDKWIARFNNPNGSAVSNESIDQLAVIIAKAIRTNKPLDESAVTQCIANSDDCPCSTADVNLDYFAGMFELIQGQKEDAIRHLRMAAGANSLKTSRTLAIFKLRDMGITPPKTGQLK